MADEGNDEHQSISECLVVLKSQQSPTTIIGAHQEDLVTTQQPIASREGLQRGATGDGVDEHKLIVQHAITLTLASSTSGNVANATSSNAPINDSGLTCDEPVQVVKATITTRMMQVEATAAAPNEYIFIDRIVRVDPARSGDTIDEDHSTIGQLLTKLNTDHSQVSRGTEVDEQVHIISQLSSVTSSEPAEPPSTLLQSEQRLAEQRLKVLHLLTEMSSNEPTIETTIDESKASESTTLTTTLNIPELQPNVQSNSIKIVDTSNSVVDEVLKDEHLLIAEHSATLAEPRLPQATAEDFRDVVLAIEENNIEISEQRAESEHQLIVHFATQLKCNSVSQELGSSRLRGILFQVAGPETRKLRGGPMFLVHTATDDVPDSRPAVNKTNDVTRRDRPIEPEHRLIAQYAEQLKNDVSQTKEIAADESTLQVEDTASKEKRQLLEHLQAQNQSLKDKLARLKEILQARDDVVILMRVNEHLTQRLSSQQERRMDLTTKRDEMMKQLRVRNSLWRSPTISQAGSELSIDMTDDQSSSLTTPITGGSGYFNFSTQMDDFALSAASDDANAESRRQIQLLQEQLHQMMKSSLQDDVMTVQSQTTSSSFWSSEKTTTTPTSTATRTVYVEESTVRSSEESGTLEVSYNNRDIDSVMPTGFATPPNSLDIPHSDSVTTECI